MPSFTLADGARLEYERLEGKATPVVFLHGILEEGAAWRGVARRVRAGGRRASVLVDSRGHGASEPFAAGMNWAPRTMADDVVELLDAIAPRGAHLVGHSHGATVASWVAVERPELVRSLAVVASPPEASEVFRAHFRNRLARLPDDAPPRERDALAWLSAIPDDEFPAHALRRYRGHALVVEAGDDPLYSPTHTLFWRAYLPYAAFERTEGGHAFFAAEEGERWLAERLTRHVEDAEREPA